MTEQEILTLVAEYYDLAVADITGPSRVAEVSEARSIVIWILVEKMKMSHRATGRILGDRCPSAVTHNLQKTRNQLRLLGRHADRLRASHREILERAGLSHS